MLADQEWIDWAENVLRKHSKRRMGVEPMRAEIERLCDRGPLLEVLGNLDLLIEAEVSRNGDERWKAFRVARNMLHTALLKLEGA